MDVYALGSPCRKGSPLLLGKLAESVLFSQKEIELPKGIADQQLSFHSF